ncbi:MAG: 4'-phosphopantetheinyl transferase superfamily protein [Anaerolineaceae bacterium]|nr:4'-phosphopantetheinyl transferase superfamily protein [Anaerolineaceae bacterium]
MDWLSPPEINRYHQFRFPKRQNEWLSGRWTAKKLLGNLLTDSDTLPFRELSIHNEDSGAPFVMWNDQRLAGSLSISHRAENAIAAFCFDPDITIGIDLEDIEAKSRGFVEDYFTEPEARMVLARALEEQALAASLLWSGREAILKALQIGLRIDTRQIAFNLPSLATNVDWQPVEILKCPAEGNNLKLFWRKLNHSLVTLAIKHNQQENDYPSSWIQQIL